MTWPAWLQPPAPQEAEATRSHYFDRDQEATVLRKEAVIETRNLIGRVMTPEIARAYARTLRNREKRLAAKAAKPTGFTESSVKA